MIDNLVELASRVSPPVDVPARPEGIDVYNGSYQYVVGSTLGIQVQTDKSVRFGEKSWGNPPEQVKSGWASLLAQINNWSRAEAVAALAKKHGINLRNPMELSGDEVALPISGNEIPVPYGEILINGEKAALKRTFAVNFPYCKREYILAIFQTPCGKVAHIPFHKAYDLPENDPCAYRWGFRPKNIPLSELDVLESYPEATVILIDDPWLAQQINQSLAFISPEAKDVVAASFWAGCSRLNAYNLMPLQGREVVFLPSLNKDSLIIGLELRETLRDVGVTDFKVLLRPLVNSEIEIEKAQPSCGEYSCSKAIVFTKRDLLLLLDELNEAWDFKRYKRYCAQEGFCQALETEIEAFDGALFKSAEEIKRAAQSQRLMLDYSYENVFSPSNITIFVGDTDVGKSLIIKSIALGIATGKPVFGMKAAAPRKVYMLSAEQDDQKSNIFNNRAMDALGIDHIPDNLLERPELSAEDIAQLGKFDFLEPRWQKALLSALEPGSVFIVDNFLTATEKGLESSPTAKKIRAFALQLKKRGITFIGMHHTKNDGTPQGSANLRSVSQNFILVHKATPRKGYEPGVNALLTFDKFKSYPPYTGKTYNAHLAYDYETPSQASWFFQEVESTHPPKDEQPQVERLKPDVGGLPQCQQLALMHAYEQGQVTLHDLVNQGIKRGTAKDCLKALKDQGRLILHKNGPASFYTLPERVS